MQSITDSVVEDVDSETSDQGKRGKRPRYFICAASHNGKVVYEPVLAESEEDAKKQFKETKGIEPSVCDAGDKGLGYYVVQGSGNNDIDRISVTVTPQQLARTTAVAFTAKFQGWEVFASGLKGCETSRGSFEDNQLLSISFSNKPPRDENGKKLPKPKLKKCEVIPADKLDNLKPLTM